MGKLSEGRGNLVRQTEMLRELGAKASKKLPQDFNGDSLNTPGKETED
jgi:DNA recombination protein RmuC